MFCMEFYTMDSHITPESESVSDTVISSVGEDLTNDGFAILFVDFKGDNHLLRHARHDLLKALSDHHTWIDNLYFDLEETSSIEITEGIGKVDLLPKSCMKIQCLPSITTLFSKLLSSSNILNTFDVPQLVPSNQHQHYTGITIQYKPILTGLFTLTKQNITKDEIEVPPGTLILYKDSDDIENLFPKNKTSTTWLGIRIGYVVAERDIYDGMLRSSLFFTGRFGIHFNPTGILNQDMIFDDRRLFAIMKPNFTKYYLGSNYTKDIDLTNTKFPNRRQLLFANINSKFTLQYFASYEDSLTIPINIPELISDTKNVLPKSEMIYACKVEKEIIDKAGKSNAPEKQSIETEKSCEKMYENTNQSLETEIHEIGEVMLQKSDTSTVLRNPSTTKPMDEEKLDQFSGFEIPTFKSGAQDSCMESAKNSMPLKSDTNEIAENIFEIVEKAHVLKSSTKRDVSNSTSENKIVEKPDISNRKGENSVDIKKTVQNEPQISPIESNSETCDEANKQRYCTDRFYLFETHKFQSDNRKRKCDNADQIIEKKCKTDDTLFKKPKINKLTLKRKLRSPENTQNKITKVDESKSSKDRALFFQRVLQTLSNCWNKDFSLQHDPITVAHEFKLQCEKFKLPERNNFYGHKIHSKHNVDEYSLEIMPNDAPSNIFPVKIIGDGNCLFRSLSMVVFGSENFHIEMRARTIIEMLTEIDYMLSDEIMTLRYGRMEMKLTKIMALSQLSDTLYKSTDCTNYDKDKKVMEKILMRIIGSSTRLNDWSGVWHIAAAARAIDTPVVCIYPSDKVGIEWNLDIRLAYHRKFPAKTCDQNVLPVYVMATRLNKPPGEFWSLDHFVACLKFRELYPNELSFVIKPGKYIEKKNIPTVEICDTESETTDTAIENIFENASQNDLCETLQATNYLVDTERLNDQANNHEFCEMSLATNYLANTDRLNDQEMGNDCVDKILAIDFFPDTEILNDQANDQEFFEKFLATNASAKIPETNDCLDKVLQEFFGNPQNHDIFNLLDSNNTAKQDDEIIKKVGQETKISPTQNMLDALKIVNKGVYAGSTPSRSQDTKFDTKSETKNDTKSNTKVEDEIVCMNFEEKIQLVGDKLKHFPFHTKFVPAEGIYAEGMKMLKRADVSDLDLQIISDCKVSPVVYFDVSHICKILNVQSEELNSEEMRNTRCFIMHKSYPTKVFEIRGVSTLHGAIKLFITMLKLRRTESKIGKYKKDPGVYSVLDKINDDGTETYAYIHSKVTRDRLYIVYRRPYEVAKGDKNYYDPLGREETIPTELTTDAEKDRQRIINSLLMEQLSKIRNNKEEAIQKIEHRLNIKDIKSFLQNIESCIWKCELAQQGKKFRSYYMHDIIESLNEQLSIMNDIDKAIVEKKMSSIVEMKIGRLVELITNIQRTTHSESIKKIYMGSTNEETAVDKATYVINFMLADPKLFVSVVEYVNDQQFVN